MFDAQVVVAILAFVGIGVVGLTEIIKRLFKAQDLFAYVISLVVSAIATVFTLLQIGSLTLLSFIVYTLIVFLEANGLYKFVKK